MPEELLEGLASKSLSKEELTHRISQNFDLLPILLKGVGSPKAAIRYGCGKILMDLSDKYPDRLYPHFEEFGELLQSKYRILTWNAMAIIANLTKVDSEKKFDRIFDEYYSLLESEYMVTVANLFGNSAKIAIAKPYLINKITERLLKVEDIAVTPHLTEECKRVIIEQSVKTFDQFFDKIQKKELVRSFVKRQLNSSRKTLKLAAERFLAK